MKSKLLGEDRERGQSMVELALTITLLMVLLAGTIDLGRAFFTWLSMRDAAQEGASYGSICPKNTTELEQRVRDNLTYNSKPYKVLPVIPSVSVGSPITVTVTTDLPITMPFLGTILGSQNIAIRATINDTILTITCPVH